jgi:hypothetical protein
MIAFDYGAWEAIDVKPETALVMFDEFDKLKRYWETHDALSPQ